MGPLMTNAALLRVEAVVHDPSHDRPRALFEVARAQQLRPAGVDLQEDLVDDLFRGLAVTEVDFRVRVEDLVVTKVEGLEVHFQVQGDEHGLREPGTVLHRRGALRGVVVPHDRLLSAGDMSRDPLHRGQSGTRRQLTRAERPLGL